jgi:uncharacterized protein YqgQ
MDDILISLLLLDITKRDLKLISVLYLLYMKSVENKGRTVKIRDIAALTGLTATAVVASLNDLVNYNVVGRLILESALERKIERNFDDSFLQTLKSINKKEKTHEAINRVGYYITDDTSIYVFNPIISSWKFLKWGQVEKTLNLLKTICDNELIEKLLKNKNTNRNKQDQSVQGISIKACLKAFCDNFHDTYGTVYTLNYQVEYSLMKQALKQITANGLLQMKDYLKFLDWAFLQSKEKGKVLHIANLKFLLNEYLVSFKPNPNYYYNDEGVLIKKG